MEINLINPEKSEIRYNTFKFNDGEPHILFAEELNRKETYKVIARVASADDLFILAQVAGVLDRAGIEWELWLSYLMGMRMDRVMSFQEAFSLEIVANVINTFKYTKVYVLEPHSRTTIRLIRNALPLTMVPSKLEENTVLVFPDQGAAIRYSEKYPDTPNMFAAKQRDALGHIISYKLVTKAPVNEDTKLLVIDDLCDGGRTFKELADILHEEYPINKTSIFITHCVNKSGIEVLCNNYDEVTITNSYFAGRPDWKFNWKNLTILNV